MTPVKKMTEMNSRRRTVGSSAIGAAMGLSVLLMGAVPAAAQSPCGPTTTVQPGDTYFSIAQRCDVSVSAIEQANPGVDPHDLQAGRTLQLTPGQDAAAEPMPDAAEAEPMPETYRVRSGDTLAAIAATLGTTVEALTAANPDLDPFSLRIGQVIRPPESGPPGDPGRPGDPGPGMQVRGVLTHEGVECPALRGQDGALYTLIGDGADAYEPGEVVEVRGTTPEASICTQGTTIEIEHIRRVG